MIVSGGKKSYEKFGTNSFDFRYRNRYTVGRVLIVRIFVVSTGYL
jgi:hypothetical protein